MASGSGSAPVEFLRSTLVRPLMIGGYPAVALPRPTKLQQLPNQISCSTGKHNSSEKHPPCGRALNRGSVLQPQLSGLVLRLVCSMSAPEMWTALVLHEPPVSLLFPRPHSPDGRIAPWASQQLPVGGRGPRCPHGVACGQQERTQAGRSGAAGPWDEAVWWARDEGCAGAD